MDEGTVMLITCVAVIVLEAIVGTIVSVYVVIIILFDFHRRKNMRTGNKIRVALSISNMLFSIVTTVGVFSGFFWNPEATSTTYVLYSLLMYSISSCSWLSAALSFFYFIKIVRFKTRGFLWVKSNIASIVPWIIVVSVTMSLGSFLIILLSTVPQDVSLEPSNSTAIIATPGYTIKTRIAHVTIIVTLVPLLTVIFTSICTIVVLEQHKHNMEKSMGPSGKVQLTAYQDAASRMMRLLFFYVTFYSFLLVFYMSEFSKLSPLFWTCCIILTSFSAVQSILLVLGNKKLKGAWREMFQCVTGSKQVTTSK